VESSPEGAINEKSWQDWLKVDVSDIDWSWDAVVRLYDTARHEAGEAFISAQKIFALLIGAPLQPPSGASQPPPLPPPREQPKPSISNAWGAAGLFSSVRERRQTQGYTAGQMNPEPDVICEQGEVHADFVRDPASGKFVFRYLFVDVPSASKLLPLAIG
jgi:hypothetical protein